MALDNLFYGDIPAIHFSFINLPLNQLNHLTHQANHLTQLLEQAKRLVSSLNALQTRVQNKQSVRCTPQSVKITAASRYTSHATQNLDLRGVNISTFVGLVTFLPLPDIKILAGDREAMRKCEQIFCGMEIDKRWGVYYRQLMGYNSDWAGKYVNGDI